LKHRFGALEGIRGLAALYVLIHHARLALTQSFANGLHTHPEHYNFIDQMMVYFFGIFKFGHEAVIIFFVLSGFVIHLRQAKNPNYKDFNISQYLKNRIIRIYPTLIFSLILCVILDYLLILISNGQPQLLLIKYTPGNFLANFFLIPETNAWGNNFPIWSLKHEWFFYLIYPFLFWLGTIRKFVPMLIVFGLYISYILAFRIPFIGSAVSSLLIWTLGVVLAEIYIHKKNLTTLFVILTTSLIIAYPFITLSHNNSFKDLAFGLICCGFFYFIITNRLIFINKFLCRFSILGVWSYSMYLLHMPLINAYQYLMRYITKQDNPPYHLWHVLTATIIIPPIIYFFFYYTERFAINYKEKISKSPKFYTNLSKVK
jgi:peptidoglycan/LPS O-acetylase OafA/YrhL